MANFMPTIRKLLLALSVKGKTYTLDRYQFYSDKAGRVCTVKSLSKVVSAKEWNRLNPDKKPKNIEKVKYVKMEILNTFSDAEILKTLAAEYKEGDTNG